MVFKCAHKGNVHCFKGSGNLDQFVAWYLRSTLDLRSGGTGVLD